MADYTNSIKNLIVNDVRTENLDQTIAKFDEFRQKLGAIAESAVGKELDVDLKKLDEDALATLGAYDKIGDKMWEIVQLAMQYVQAQAAIKEQAAGGTGADAMVAYQADPRVIELQERLERDLENTTVAQKNLNQAQQESVQTTNQVAAATEADTQAINTLPPAIDKVILEHAKLSESQKESIERMAGQHVSIDGMRTVMGEAAPTVHDLGMYLQQLGYTIKDSSGNTVQFSNDIGSNISQMRGLRYGALEVMGALSMVSIAVGETLPDSFRELQRATMLITSGGLMAAMMNFPLPIGLAAGAVLALGSALFTIDQQTQDLEKNLQTLSKKDELVTTLSNILGISQEDAQALMDMGQKSAAAAKDLLTLEQSARQLSTGERTIRDLTTAWGDFFKQFSGGGAGLDKQVLGSVLGVLVSWEPALGNIVSLMKEWDDKANAVSQSNAKAAQTALAVDEAIQKETDSWKPLGDALDRLAKKDDAVQMLSDLTGKSVEDAQAVLDQGSKHLELSKILDDEGKAIKAVKDRIAEYQVEGKNTSVLYDELTEKTQKFTETFGFLAQAAQNDIAIKKAQADATQTLNGAETERTNWEKKQAEDRIKSAQDEYDRKTKMAQDSQKAYQSYTESIASADRALKDSEADQDTARLNNARKNSEDLVKIARDLNDKLSDLQVSHNAQMLGLQQDDAAAVKKMNEELASEAQGVADKEVDAAYNAAQKRDQLINDLANHYRTYYDGVADETQNEADKESDIAYSLAQKKQDLLDQLARAQENYAHRVEDIDRSLSEDVYSRNFDLYEQLRNATTPTQREDIYRRYQFELQMMNQRATDQKSDAQFQLNQSKSTYQQQMDDADQAAQHSIEVAHREEAEKMASLKRTLDEAVAHNSKKVQDAEQAAQHELDIIHREEAQKIAEIKQTQTDAHATILERIAKEEASYTQQQAEAKRRNQEQLDDLKITVKEQEKTLEDQRVQQLRRNKEAKDDAWLRYQDEIKSLNQRYDQEKQKARETQEAATVNHNLKMEQFQREFEEENKRLLQLDAEKQKIQDLTQAEKSLPSIVPPTSSNPSLVGPGFASGGSFTIPAGFPNDTYPMRGSSGENVTISPAGSSGGVTFMIPIYGNVYGVDDLRSLFEQALMNKDRGVN